jgi:hypothetical protein
MSSDKAKKKYAAKYDSTSIGQKFEQSKAIALHYQGAYMPSLFELKKKIYAALQNTGINANQLLAYFYFGESIVKLRNQHSGMPLYLEAALAKFKWNQRGLDNSLMNQVLKVAGVNPANLPVFAGGAGGDVNLISVSGTPLTAADWTLFLQHLNADLSGLATQTTLNAIKNLLPTALDSGALKIKEQNPITSVTVNTISGFATETTLGDIETDIDTIASALDSGALKVKEQNPISSISVSNMVDVSALAKESGGNLEAIETDIDSIVSALILPTALDSGALKVKEQSPLSTIGVTSTYLDAKLSDIKALLPTALDSGALKIKEQNPISSLSVSNMIDVSALAKESGGNLDSIEDELDNILVKLDVALSTRALETGGNLAAILAKLDVALSTRALEAGGNLAAILAKLDVALSTRALEAGGNLAAILAKLDVALSTRALETGGNLAAILAKLDVALSTRALETGGNLASILTAVAIPTGIGTLADLTGNSAAQQFTASNVPCKAILVRALTANTGNVRVGDSSVSASRGAELSGGDSCVLVVSNVNLGYFYGVSPDKISITYVT